MTDLPVANVVDCADWEVIKSQYWTGAGDPPLIGPCNPAIPAVSEWGVAVLALLLLAAGKLRFHAMTGESAV